MARRHEDRIAWSAAWGVMTAVFAYLAQTAWASGRGAGNHTPEPAFAMLVLAAVVCAYLMVAALARWPPYKGLERQQQQQEQPAPTAVGKWIEENRLTGDSTFVTTGTLDVAMAYAVQELQVTIIGTSITDFVMIPSSTFYNVRYKALTSTAAQRFVTAPIAPSYQVIVTTARPDNLSVDVVVKA